MNFEDDWISCQRCLGDGGWHDCGDDSCPCLNPERDYWVECRECEGHGGWQRSDGTQPEWTA
jgi:hypothetical protein